MANFPFPSSPKRTLVFLEGFVNEHVSLHFVLPIERRLAQSALVWFFTWKTQPESLRAAGLQTYRQQTHYRQKINIKKKKKHCCEGKKNFDREQRKASWASVSDLSECACGA